MDQLHLSTKAKTLEQLRELLDPNFGTVAELFYFTVADWKSAPGQTIDRLVQLYAGRKLVVRSSTKSEDTLDQSMAGTFRSVLDVDSDPDSIRIAINQVVDSYGGNPDDQVLVQPMVNDTAVAGVVTTHSLTDGAPYYVVSYDETSGKTDTVTGGRGASKTVLVRRSCDLALLKSSPLLTWLKLIQHVESLCPGVPLEMEFGQSVSGALYVFQVRQLSVRQKWARETAEDVERAHLKIDQLFFELSQPKPGIAGRRTILGSMPDWNPAEIIGTNPRQLSASLYRYLVTDDVWREARHSMGYRRVGEEKLMVLLCGLPYIDVRNSFNSFLPANLDEEICEKLVEAWLDRLDQRPELHDKVEFEIATTALDLQFEQFRERYPGLLNEAQESVYRRSLRELTKGNLKLEESSSLLRALGAIAALHQRGLHRGKLSDGDQRTHAAELLAGCRQLGTLSFAVIARHAFIAETLLRSSVRIGVLSPQRISDFKSSLMTVAGEFTRDYQLAVSGQLPRQDFLTRYGHLRPGTYDILSLRYDQREEVLSEEPRPPQKEQPARFDLTGTETRSLRRALDRSGLGEVSPQDLLRYARLAIVGRERAKFVFTRHLSEALELLAEWGHSAGLSREQLSFIGLNELLDSSTRSGLKDEGKRLLDIAERGRREHELSRTLRLHHLIRSDRDLSVASMHRAEPSFITTARVSGRAVFLSSRTTPFPDLTQAIVCIENADPGFDWIFTRNIKGLITRYGGPNSHMAVRCAELGLPAALGCGERAFTQLSRAVQIELDCDSKRVRQLD